MLNNECHFRILYFFQDSTHHVPSETSEDPEVEVTIEG